MNAASPPRRYLSVWLRRLATDRIMRARSSAPAENAPLVVVEEIKSALRLAAVNDAAARLGLKPGMALADARAMYPAIAVADADPEADRHLLEAIADWCDRYTPLVGLDPPDGLMLDITGCAHLFGGEAALGGDIVRRLAAQGFQARVAVADTVGCAWAVARYASNRNCKLSRRTQPRTLPLPLAALRIAPDIVAALAQVGLKRIADVIDRPRAPLAARFGVDFVRRLDQALGREDEPITPRLPVPALCDGAPLSPSRSRSKPTCSPPSSIWRRSSAGCWSGAAKVRAVCRPRCSAPTARCIASRSAPARRCAMAHASARCSPNGSPRSATPAIPASAST